MDYGNLLILSKGEADPLSVVVNYTSGQNLYYKPF